MSLPSARRALPVVATLLIWSLSLAATTAFAEELPLDQLRLPAGFEMTIFAADVPGARSLALSPGGIVYVGTMRQGVVYAVIDRDHDHRADEVLTLAEELFMPNGVAFREGSLYVAEVNRILRFDDIDARLRSSPEPVVVRDDLPDKRHHGWKFIAFGPDGKLYVPVGAPCNVCDEGDPYAAILRMQPDGSESEVLARGIRNTVGFDWHPQSGELWFTDNGRDMLGDDIPPDELNRLTEAGQHFGFPFCHAGTIEDPEFGDRGECGDTVAPALLLGPHVAAIGMRFYRGDQFPADLHGSILIAEHGSWNRSSKVGYRITAVDVAADGKASNYRTVVDGWLQESTAWGRPSDLLELPDGSLLISDDKAGVIYRLSYAPSSAASAGRQ